MKFWSIYILSVVKITAFTDLSPTTKPEEFVLLLPECQAINLIQPNNLPTSKLIKTSKIEVYIDRLKLIVKTFFVPFYWSSRHLSLVAFSRSSCPGI
jgi:hypothetical protein